MDVTIPALAIVRDLGLAYEQAAQGQSQPDGQNDGQRAKQPAPWLVAPDEQSLWRSGQIGDGDGMWRIAESTGDNVVTTGQGNRCGGSIVDCNANRACAATDADLGAVDVDAPLP